MEIITILAFIALIAVIFGISMHQAFWGIVIFIGLAILAAIAKFFLNIYIDDIKEKKAFYKTSAGKAAKKTKKEISKQKHKETAKTCLIILCISFPIILPCFLNEYFKSFFEANLGACIIVSFIPLAILLSYYLIHIAKVVINIKKGAK